MTDTSPGLDGSRWFTCASCDRVFLTDRTEEEAIAEFNATFQPETISRAVKLCEACYLDYLPKLGLTKH